MKKSQSLQIDGSRIRARRMQLGWTQQELADRPGYCERLVRKAERGECLSVSAAGVLAETLSDDDYVFTFGEICSSERRAMNWVSNELFGRSKSHQSDRTLDKLTLGVSATIVIQCIVATPEVPLSRHAEGLDEMFDWIATFRECVVPIPEQESSTAVSILQGSFGYLFQEVKIVSGNVASSPVPIHCNLHFHDGLLNRIRVHADSAEIVSFNEKINRNGLKQPRICHA